jgi:hypothetical protein
MEVLLAYGVSENGERPALIGARPATFEYVTERNPGVECSAMIRPAIHGFVAGRLATDF